jgi:hypothetical protein
MFMRGSHITGKNDRRDGGGQSATAGRAARLEFRAIKTAAGTVTDRTYGPLGPLSPRKDIDFKLRLDAGIGQITMTRVQGSPGSIE